MRKIRTTWIMNEPFCWFSHFSIDIKGHTKGLENPKRFRFQISTTFRYHQFVMNVTFPIKVVSNWQKQIWFATSMVTEWLVYYIRRTCLKSQKKVSSKLVLSKIPCVLYSMLSLLNKKSLEFLCPLLLE